ncbi:MAG: type II secretion system GspH family protein [Lentisphaeraceae bacterium]|nr:type II secretion system GspH family protein [Lentisphaeraceae bacterium]
MNSHDKKRQFTLIELLVVVSILGILSTILLPSLTRARSQAQNAVCISNLKQISITNQVFMKDNGGAFPKSFHKSASVWKTWHNQFDDMLDGNFQQERSGSEDPNGSYSSYCPAYEDKIFSFIKPGKTQLQQPEFSAGPDGKTSQNMRLYLSYGINEWLSNNTMNPSGYPGGGFKSDGSPSYSAWYENGVSKVFLSKIQEPGKTMAFSETYLSPFIRSWSRIYYNPNHGPQANVVYVDCSANIKRYSAISEEGASGFGVRNFSSYTDETVNFFGYSVSPFYTP